VIGHILQLRFQRTLTRATSSRLYPALVGLMAFGATISMTIPFAPILIIAVLLRRDRSLPIVLLSALSSAVGGLVLYLVFHHLGWNNFMALYPDLAHSQ
jgi:membrane protein YqaA with SNARE-associated domain